MFQIQNRPIGPTHPPFIIAEIGINHDGNFDKALQMIDDAAEAGAECCKFQTHCITDTYGEMLPNNVIPGNATESIYTMMQRCAFTEQQEGMLKNYVEEKGMIYLSTPFSRAAVDRLERLGVCAYKIGSGECNNYPLIEYISKTCAKHNPVKPVILSTGMNDEISIMEAVRILDENKVPCAILQCTSMYPTPYNKVNLWSLSDLQNICDGTIYNKGACVGLSCHSLGNYTAFAAVALGASIIEKHFTSDKTWSGSDVPISLTPPELKDLIHGCNAVWQACQGTKQILPEEKPTINFAYASVCSIANIKKGDVLTEDNIWVKRPYGPILAADYNKLLGKTAKHDIENNKQLNWEDFE